MFGRQKAVKIIPRQRFGLFRPRNRSNARKSTGPKTARGKAAVAGNSRKHGMTARPDPASVATWLAVITGNPDISLQDLMPQDDLAYRALGLAQAEARLMIAEGSMRVYEAGYADRDDAMWDLERAAGVMHELRAQRTGTSQELQTVVTTGSLGSQSSIDAGHDRLMHRYLAETQAQRRKAFCAWIVAGGAARSRAPQGAQTLESRNKARFQLKGVYCSWGII